MQNAVEIEMRAYFSTFKKGIKYILLRISQFTCVAPKISVRLLTAEYCLSSFSFPYP
jgi:hypothetical protein